MLENCIVVIITTYSILIIIITDVWWLFSGCILFISVVVVAVVVVGHVKRINMDKKMKKNNDTKSIFMNRFIWFGLCLAVWCGVVCFGLLEKGGPVPKYTIQAYTHLDH